MSNLRIVSAAILAFALIPMGLGPGRGFAQTKVYPLDSLQGLKLYKMAAEPVTYKFRKAIKLTVPSEPGAAARAPRPTKAGKASKAGANTKGPRRLEAETNYAILEGVEFHDGIIQVDVAGMPAEGAGGGARGFIGIVFRMAPDLSRHERIYLRPTNGRADDQERRNHSVQYVSYPDFPWQKLRNETPSKYETYADLVPGEWTKLKIEVRGDKARIYVHDVEQPTLIVNDLKLGADAKGSIALWINPSTEGYFSNLRISP